jgi:hypothetical protein
VGLTVKTRRLRSLTPWPGAHPSRSLRRVGFHGRLPLEISQRPPANGQNCGVPQRLKPRSLSDAGVARVNSCASRSSHRLRLSRDGNPVGRFCIIGTFPPSRWHVRVESGIAQPGPRFLLGHVFLKSTTKLRKEGKRVKKPRGMNIKNSKDRGAWAEMCFALRAIEEGLRPARPWGEPSGYDSLVHHKSTRIFRIQVKSTIYKMGRCYHCTIRTGNHPYKKDAFDFVAAYVIPEDVWYILPEKVVRGMSTVGLYPAMAGAKYDAYKEAWHLLRGETPGFVARIDACAEDFPEVTFPPTPSACPAPDPTAQKRNRGIAAFLQWAADQIRSGSRGPDDCCARFPHSRALEDVW